MKRSFGLFWHLQFLILLTWIGSAAGQDRTASLTVGRTVKLQSRTLKQPRFLRISKPNGYEEESEHYPVLYVLDGESNFQFTAAMVRFLADNDRIPAMIVVGVDSGSVARRTHDLTPLTKNEAENRFSPRNGGADQFLAFMSGELLPFVERNYRTRPYRILVGHSFGGLFALHALASKPNLFNAYIAIDPTAGWNNGEEISRLKRLLTESKDLQTDLFITASNDLGKATPDVQQLAEVLQANKPTDLRWKFEWMKDETHGTIPLIGTYSGLCAIFDGWYLADPLRVFDEGGLDAIDKYFRDGGKRADYERLTPPFTLSLVVHGLIRRGDLDTAATVAAGPKSLSASLEPTRRAC
jgi:predicted alpha/beta superfamily hydrolase